MKLLFDENLAAGLAISLGDIYPQSVHVRDIGLKSSPDSVVWDYAAGNGYAIVTKDADFRQRSFLYSHPPKVIWVRLGNCSTRQVGELLRRQRMRIEAFFASDRQSFLPGLRRL